MACVGQGIVYVGGAVGALRVMAARAEHRRRDGSLVMPANGSSDHQSVSSSTGEADAAPDGPIAGRTDDGGN